VLNSWKWTDEEFHFSDGWLAFVGRNGSGKSLTASQLVTVLLDGDTSQTALSVSGRAAGTLISRHTDNRDRDDKTGVWWLEYGRTDAATGTTEYVTTGLWLRSSGQSLLRAFFLLPGRVGKELILQVDRNAVGIDDLARQLAAARGELYTDAQRLKPKATAHLTAIGPESGYRDAVRTRLFAPLDEIQYDALLSVLRTLRSVRTAEKISARDMLEVLTGALPALDQGKLSEIAAAMQRIATLEAQLADTREQARKLADTDRVYELYRRAVSLTVAAALRSANTEFDNLARHERAAKESLANAERAAHEGRHQLEQARLEASKHEGELRAADTAVRDHAGAELPHHEERARDLTAAAAAAKERAELAETDAKAANEQAAEATRDAMAAQTSLANIVRELTSTAGALRADSALTNVLSTTEELTRLAWLDPATDPEEVPVDELAATPLAWVEMRQKNVEAVTAALGEVAAANRVAVDTADQHRAAQDEEDRRRKILARCAAARSIVERELEDAVTGWQQTATLFPAVPDTLLEPDPVEGRVEPTSLTRWLDHEAAMISDRLDVSGHRARKETADRAFRDAESFANSRRTVADEALGVVETTEARHDEQARLGHLAAEADAEKAQRAEHEHATQVDAARQHRHDHLLTQVARAAETLSAFTDWTERIGRWWSELRHIDVAALAPHRPSAEATGQLLARLNAAHSQTGTTLLSRAAPVVALAEQSLETLTAYNDGPLRTAVAEVAQRAFAQLERSIADAEHTVGKCIQEIDAVTADLKSARQAPLPPPVPIWRTRSDGSPLWSLIDFRDGVPSALQDRCEGALLVSGLLDAVVTADGMARVGDTVLTGEQPVDGPSLADILITEPGTPIDPARTRALLRSIALLDTEAGTTVRSGVLTATAPDGYIARYIGPTTRERARAERIALLENRLNDLTAEHTAAEQELERRRTKLTAAIAEQDGLPPSVPWQQVRDEARTAQLAASEADREATDRVAHADTTLRSVQDELAAAQQDRDRVLASIQAELATAIALSDQAKRTAAEAAEKAEEAATLAEKAAAQLADAVATQELASDQRHAFPPLTALVTAITEEDEATRDLTSARSAVVTAEERFRGAQGKTRQALTMLNQAVDLGDGRMLPAEPAALKRYTDRLTQMTGQVHSWQRVTDKALQLGAHARTAATTAATRGRLAGERAREAATAQATAVRAQAEVARLRELYGAAYEKLRLARERSAQACVAAQEQLEQVRNNIHEAEKAESGARSTLESIAPQRETAEERRETCLRQMYRLVNESIAAVDEDVQTDDLGRPANLTAALAWGARMLAAEPRARDDLTKLLETRRTRLEAEAKKVSAELTRFDRQVTLQTIPGSDWRRAIVAAPDALDGEDLHTTVLTLRETAHQLETDLRDDVKVTLKTSLFTALRRDIATRRAAAQELVRQIRSTLGDVRTGVARVGVEVDWKVKRDPDAQRMIELVRALPSDDTFEQMYEVLRQRLEEATGDTWESRVAHTFDYRLWHEWDIKVTHASFGEGKTEAFRQLTARSNPLASFSTGEMRLATMLPLLAAAWSMYEAPGYRGPRLLFVDEMNAAFDPQNVRKLLALLREWQFDVLSTAPDMSALLKAESERAMIAQVIQSGALRVSMPWLWTGSGRPQLVADRIGNSSGASEASS
jgi:hypothetical protein